MSSEFEGRSFFISGGAKGLGRAITLDLVACGSRIGVMDIDVAALSELERDAAELPGTLHVYEGNAGRRATFEKAVGTFAAASGGLDGVINNAAYLVYEPLEAISEETFDRMIDAGFKSAVWGSQALLTHRKVGVPGNIINFSSPVAYRGYPNAAIYSAVKSATTSLTRTLAAELGPQGIRVNAIALDLCLHPVRSNMCNRRNTRGARRPYRCGVWEPIKTWWLG